MTLCEHMHIHIILQVCNVIIIIVPPECKHKVNHANTEDAKREEQLIVLFYTLPTEMLLVRVCVNMDSYENRFKALLRKAHL